MAQDIGFVENGIINREFVERAGEKSHSAVQRTDVRYAVKRRESARAEQVDFIKQAAVYINPPGKRIYVIARCHDMDELTRINNWIDNLIFGFAGARCVNEDQIAIVFEVVM